MYLYQVVAVIQLECRGVQAGSFASHMIYLSCSLGELDNCQVAPAILVSTHCNNLHTFFS
jgi:hypothetical protein